MFGDLDYWLILRYSPTLESFWRTLRIILFLKGYFPLSPHQSIKTNLRLDQRRETQSKLAEAC